MTARLARKRPVTVEYMVYDSEESLHDIADWLEENGGQPYAWHDGTSWHVQIPTLEGDLYLTLGDRVVRGTSGEFYPVKPDIWPAIYEDIL